MSACEGKTRYRSRVDALLALARIQRRDDSDREKLPSRAYRCDACRRWHLTSMSIAGRPLPAVTDQATHTEKGERA